MQEAIRLLDQHEHPSAVAPGAPSHTLRGMEKPTDRPGPSETPPWLVPLIRRIRAFQPHELVRLGLTVELLVARDGAKGRQQTLDATIGRLRRDHRRYPYESAMRMSAMRAREAVDTALSKATDYMPLSAAHRESVYDGAVELALIRTLAYELVPDEFEALWAPYEAAMPDLYRFRSEAFVFETVEELEEVLRTPGLAEVIVMEGGEPRDRWDLRCASCGEEFIPFGWHQWRGTTCEFCRGCPTTAFVEPQKTEGGETIHFMRVFPVGGVDVVWPPR